MSDGDEDDLLAIAAVADDSNDDDEDRDVSRTFQSETDFRLQKASYTAKISDGSNYEALLAAVHVLQTAWPQSPSHTADNDAESTTTTDASRTTLNKKDVQLLGYAVGELYYDHRYDEVVALCQRVRHLCHVEARLAASLDRWTAKSQQRIAAEKA